MADAIFDASGAVVAWRNRDLVYDRGGHPVAFIWDRGVFRFDGRCIGWYLDGVFWAPDGRAVGLARGATGGPPPPARYEPLVAPRFRPDPPVPRPARVPEPPRMRTPRWSALSWQAFLAGESGTEVSASRPESASGRG